MLPAGFEPTIPTSDRPQTLALDRSATDIGKFDPRTVQLAAIRYTDWAVPAYLMCIDTFRPRLKRPAQEANH